ncbi:unnamed protein product [Enterobius vermicularis]|uniref:J domain-containing protein n=1 Tax=Enterobius vermicularis TaxID=51028 RepID=A0A0N4V542_ENTVE|nr:unnamed protein product [Enterobius vermicularis]
MSSFVEDAKRLFGTSNLYQILQLNSKPVDKYNSKQIKRAYLEQSLKYHPDRAAEEEKERRTEQFQILSRAYAVLIDDEKRKVYDETGIILKAFAKSRSALWLHIGLGVIDEDEVSDEWDWEVYWRRLFRKVTLEELQLFCKQYRESGEEKKDLKASYLKNKGDMSKIMDEVLGVTYEDEDRLRNMINEMIESGELKSMPKFVSESKSKRNRRRKAAEREAKEAQEALREIETKEGTSGLFALIQARQQKREGASFDAFCDSLAEKYGKGKAKRKKLIRS